MLAKDKGAVARQGLKEVRRKTLARRTETVYEAKRSDDQGDGSLPSRTLAGSKAEGAGRNLQAVPGGTGVSGIHIPESLGKDAHLYTGEKLETVPGKHPETVPDRKRPEYRAVHPGGSEPRIARMPAVLQDRSLKAGAENS